LDRPIQLGGPIERPGFEHVALDLRAALKRRQPNSTGQVQEARLGDGQGEAKGNFGAEVETTVRFSSFIAESMLEVVCRVNRAGYLKST
jgi:hypothetical protein